VTANFEVAVTGQSPIVGYAGNTFLLLSFLSEYTLGLVHHVLHTKMARLGAPWWEECFSYDLIGGYVVSVLICIFYDIIIAKVAKL
jgi:hypothetical protein